MTDKPTSAPKDAPGDVAGLIERLHRAVERERLNLPLKASEVTINVMLDCVAALSAPQHPAEQSRGGGLPTIAPGHWDSEGGHEVAVEYVGKSRADLAHGELSDFLLANRVFMAGRGDLDLIAWQTAAKERIRWLSAQLALETTPQPAGDAGEEKTDAG
jgi:hypothetical protein